MHAWVSHSHSPICLCSPQKVFCVWILNYFKKRDEQRGRGEENVRQ